jgi:hypothetical protein
MDLRLRRVRIVGLLAAAGIVAGMTATAGVASAATVTCPAVDPVTHAVSPAPAPGVDWSGCNPQRR